MDILNAVTDKLEGFTRLIGNECVFGKPERMEGKTILPVAEVSWSGDAGFGVGEEQPKDDPGAGHRVGKGGGGGGKVKVRPVSLVEITPDQTRIVPILDRTKIILAGMFLMAWNIFWLAYTIRKLLRKWR